MSSRINYFHKWKTLKKLGDLNHYEFIFLPSENKSPRICGGLYHRYLFYKGHMSRHASSKT